MGPRALTRRRVLGAAAGAAAVGLVGCDDALPPLQGGWVGPSPARGHRLRDGASLPAAAVQRRAAVLVVGAGIAGLAAARAFSRAGIDDVQVLELDDAPGGNSRGHVLGGQRCPLGAHYLPLPAAASPAHELVEWLHEIGLLRHELGRTVAEERHLAHSPQERLFFDGQWLPGLLPPADAGSATLAQYRRFSAAVAQEQQLGFALPTTRAPWTPAHAALDAVSFAAWLQQHGLDDARLRWYLDHCCRDDYGAGIDTVSAWAGLHYFASRNGFFAPGDGPDAAEPVFTWPEGNAWLAERLAQPLAGRLHLGRSVLSVDEGRHGVDVLAWDDAAGRAEAWRADRVVLAVPLFVAARVLRQPPAALRVAVAGALQAPWLVANLHLSRPLLDRPGAAPAWDNVLFGDGAAAHGALGYVDAGHQRLGLGTAPAVLTAYHALPVSQRGALQQQDWPEWAARVLAALAPAHPDLRAALQRIELTRWGHAMAVPTPGRRGSAALAALRTARGRVRFVHADLAGYSVFEEAFTLGMSAAAA